MPPGSQIPIDRTAPALDLDLLLGGLKPVIQGLNPQDVNALIRVTGPGPPGPGRHARLAALQDVVVHQLARRQQSAVVEQLIENLKTMLDTLSKDGDQFSGAIDHLEKLIKRPVARTATRSARRSISWTTAPRRCRTC